MMSRSTVQLFSSETGTLRKYVASGGVEAAMASSSLARDAPKASIEHSCRMASSVLAKDESSASSGPSLGTSIAGKSEADLQRALRDDKRDSETAVSGGLYAQVPACWRLRDHAVGPWKRSPRS